MNITFAVRKEMRDVMMDGNHIDWISSITCRRRRSRARRKKHCFLFFGQNISIRTDG